MTNDGSTAAEIQGRLATVNVSLDAVDANVRAVIEKHLQRAAVGLRKYGVTTERTDLSLREWLEHAQTEAMDEAIYLQRIIKHADLAIAELAVELAQMQQKVAELDSIITARFKRSVPVEQEMRRMGKARQSATASQLIEWAKKLGVPE